MAQANGRGSTLADFIWKNAEDLWGDFKHTDFGKVILPFTLLRRLECVLEPTRDAVRAAYLAQQDSDLDLDLILPGTKSTSLWFPSSVWELGTGSSASRAPALRHRRPVPSRKQSFPDGMP